MDIMISSNFERLLFDLYDRDGAAIAGLMADAKAGHMDLSDKALGRRRGSSSPAIAATMRVCSEIIRDTYADCDYLSRPAHGDRPGGGHDSAAAEQLRRPWSPLATAHPAKFPDAVRQAGYPQDPELPPHMADLFEREERFTVLDNDQAAVQQFIAGHITV